MPRPAIASPAGTSPLTPSTACGTPYPAALLPAPGRTPIPTIARQLAALNRAAPTDAGGPWLEDIHATPPPCAQRARSLQDATGRRADSAGDTRPIARDRKRHACGAPQSGAKAPRGKRSAQAALAPSHPLAGERGTGAIYARFSTDKQGDASIEEQVRICAAWWRIVAGRSPTPMRMPGCPAHPTCVRTISACWPTPGAGFSMWWWPRARSRNCISVSRARCRRFT